MAGKRGRPTKRSATVEKELLRLLRNGNTRTTAAIASGISVRTMQRWCALSDRFCRVVTQAEQEAVALYVNALTSNAVSGDTKAIIFYLTHRHGDDWKPPKERQEITGAGGGPLIVERVEFGKGE